MTDRSRLPNRRECVRYEFPHGGFRYVATVGLHPQDGKPGELFLHAAKAGTSVEAAAREGCPNIATSSAMSASVTSVSAARTAVLTLFHLPCTGQMD